MNMVKYVAMSLVHVNIAEAKAKFSELSRKVKGGQRIILCDRNKPFAEIKPLQVNALGNRPLGLARGLLPLPDSFNDPDTEVEAEFTEVHPNDPLTS
jgi:antitoxin (DNA-binding transcriptional repressor) of toxin-antitoxin stability system